MKKILVATDFSPSAENALYYAARMAQQLNAGLILLHVYQIPISMSDVPVLMVSAEELRNNADAGLNKAEESLREKISGVEIEAISRLGDVVGEINDICEKQKPFAVVVGKRGASGVEQFLFGSTALSVIRSSRTPVITVPDAVHDCRLQQVALASDGNFPGEHEGWIRNFLLETGARFHIVHISESKEDKKDVSHILPDLQPGIHLLTSEDFSEAIDAFMHENQIDILIVLPHKHSLMERLLFKTHTAELIKNISLPVLTIGEM